jgi:hypothetical protein
MDKNNKRGVRTSSQKRDTSHGDHAPASAVAPVPGAFGDGGSHPKGILEDEEARQKVEEGSARPESPEY